MYTHMHVYLHTSQITDRPVTRLQTGGRHRERSEEFKFGLTFPQITLRGRYYYYYLNIMLMEVGTYYDLDVKCPLQVYILESG